MNENIIRFEGNNLVSRKIELLDDFRVEINVTVKNERKNGKEKNCRK